MDIWTILTIVSIPPTVVYYAAKWHRARLAKRREEIVRRVQTGIPLERAVYRLRLRENEARPITEGYVSPAPSAGDVAMQSIARGVIVESGKPVSEETLMREALVKLGLPGDTPIQSGSGSSY